MARNIRREIVLSLQRSWIVSGSDARIAPWAAFCRRFAAGVTAGLAAGIGGWFCGWDWGWFRGCALANRHGSVHALWLASFLVELYEAAMKQRIMSVMAIFQ